MKFRSSLASSCGLFLLASVLTACPSSEGETDPDTASDTQQTTSTGSTGSDTTTGSTGTTEEPTSSTAVGSTGAAGPAYADVQAIFSQTCNCHLTPPNPGNGLLELTPDVSHANLVGVASSQATMTSRVEPGDPSKSYLWLKLTGSYLDVPGGTGDPMPLAGDLTDEQLMTIEQWILAGAPAE